MDQASLLGASEDVLKLYLTAFGVSTAGLTKNDIIRYISCDAWAHLHGLTTASVVVLRPNRH